MVILLAGVVLLLAIAAILWFGTPRLVEVAPAEQAKDVPAGAALRLRFSRPMQAASLDGRLSVSPFRTGQISEQGDELVFTPDLPWQPGETVTVNLKRGVRAAGLFQLPLLQERSWSFTIRRPSLAYLYPSDRAANIYLIDPVSGESSQLTESLAGVVDFDIDTRGEALYYSALIGDSGSAIYRLDLTNTEAAPLSILECPQALCTSPRIAPGNDFLAYEKTASPARGEAGYPQVWLMPLTGEPTPESGPTVADQEPKLAGDPQHQTIQPQWSPDGLLTYYDSVQKAFIVLDLKSGERREFPNQTGQPGSWSPDGLAYVVPEILDNPTVSPAPDPATFPVVSSHLMRFNLSGSQQDLTAPPRTGGGVRASDLEDTSPAFSPDGKLLAFARKYLNLALWTPGRQLWLMRPDGTEARPVSNAPYFNHFNFAWSPSGDRIAYVRFNQNAPTDPPEVWLVDLDSGLETQIVIGGFAPRWIP
jgi:Bacterial Ig-like domain/WD40-like Beta Propeller Repeat